MMLATTVICGDQVMRLCVSALEAESLGTAAIGAHIGRSCMALGP